MASAANNNDEKTTQETGGNPAGSEVNGGAIEPEQRVQVQGLPLDWTQMSVAAPPIRYPQDVAEMSKDETEICIVGTAGQKITNIGATFSQEEQFVNPNITQLVLRSHAIRIMEGLDKFEHLELLELYDNQVEALACLDNGEGYPGITLRNLDMSYNGIREMMPVSLCPNLQELYLANNKVKSIEGLKGLNKLRKVDLGANRIRVMEADELSGLVNLEELWLGKNKIEKIEGLDALTKLRRLDVQANRLTQIENLVSQRETLEELYLAHNAITAEGASIESGLAQDFPNLTVLDLGRNRLTTTQPFGHLRAVEELWLSGNKIAEFVDVAHVAALPLDTIYLEYNPLQQDPLYRKRVAEILPNLKQIDANLIQGLGAHGMATARTSEVVETAEEQARRLQDMAISRAKDESQVQNQS